MTVNLPEEEVSGNSGPTQDLDRLDDLIDPVTQLRRVILRFAVMMIAHSVYTQVAIRERLPFHVAG